MSVKDNQPNLLTDSQPCFEKGLETDFADMEHSYYEEGYRGHGRVEKQCVHTILNPTGIRDEALWQDLKAITFVYTERQELGKETVDEARYSIGSRAAKANVYANSIRSHWGIEHGLHWVLDVWFNEDQSRMRTDHSPENMARLRRLAWYLLKKHGRNGSSRGKRLQSGWNDEFLLEVLSCK